jgi:hypothetical protein
MRRGRSSSARRQGTQRAAVEAEEEVDTAAAPIR